MNLINLKVKNKALGDGVITEVIDNYIIVKFLNTEKTSKFVYPDAFEKFLVAEDEKMQTEIIKDLNNAKQNIMNQYKAIVEVENAKKGESTTKSHSSQTKKAQKNIEDGFGPDYNVKYLSKHPILTYQQVESQFGIKIAGFGRGINSTETSVVLISSINKKKSGFVYHDHWTNEGEYIYSGEGKTGDQKMQSGNKAIVDAKNDKKAIHLFVKFSPKEYYYQGIFDLVDYGFEDEKDETGNMRKEYKFKLRKQQIED